MRVQVIRWGDGGALAYVDGVRVRIRTRATGPAVWLCDGHPDLPGRQGCEHTEALAAHPADPRDRQPPRNTPKENPNA